MAVYPSIVSATGFVYSRTPGSEEIDLIVLYQNNQDQGVARFVPFKHDISAGVCLYRPENISDECAPLTKWGLKVKRTLAIFGQGLFNNGCVQSFACTTTGCASCPSFGSSYISFLTNIPIRAEDLRVPGAPPGLSVTQANGALVISWGAATGADIFAYSVNVWQGSTLVAGGWTEDTLRTVTIGGLTNGVSYTVDVFALSHNNILGPKSTATGTPAGATNPLVYDISTAPSAPKAGDSVTIKGSLANTGPNGKVRAVFKVNGTQISDQNSTLNTFPGGGLWEPTAPYTMPSSTITITVEAYGWDGSKWVLTDTKSITRTPAVTPCSSVTLTPFSASIKAGEKVTFTAAVTPSTSPFTVQFKDRVGTLLGTCTTSGGNCTFIWDSAGKTIGTYYVKAYVVEGSCVSTESVIQVSPALRQWNVNIYVRDSVTNNPVEGATVVAGTQNKVTDANGYVLFRVDEGVTSISISKTGYNTFTTTELVYSDKTFNYVLSPTGIAKGSIHFVSLPTGAEIFIDGSDQGVRTNYTVTNIPAGEHTFTLKLSGYNDFTGNVTVLGGSVIEVYVSMTPSTPGSGALYAASTPGGADITIDGQLQTGKTPATITNLTPGSHEVKLTKAGYQDFTATVTITAGTTTYLSAALSVLPGIGTLEISSTPVGARVFIDGADTQKVTPATITTLSSGDHTYKLVMSGYRDATGTFTIEPGMTTAVTVPLQKAEERAAGTAIIVGLAAAAGIAVAIAVSR